jgi:hypothetical protein
MKSRVKRVRPKRATQRYLANCAAAFVALQFICGSALAVSTAELQRPRVFHKHEVHGERADLWPDPRPAPVETSPVTSLQPGVTLSSQEREVSRIADQNGDREFLMVDKALGKIILFKNGEPAFSGTALTGASLADRIPRGELEQPFSIHVETEEKITPAGRFTVNREHDRSLGEVLDVNEIWGKDWGIAIHQVWLGAPSEHRELRLISPNDQDKHISFGCINVEGSTIRYLLGHLPRRKATPLYILPQDETQTEQFFLPRKS